MNLPLANLFGLHPLDVIVIVAAVLLVLAIGFRASHGVTDSSDFFVGGRRLGAWLQFFMNFGQMSDSSSAPTIATECYRQGIGGVWVGLQLLIVTPCYWFASIWFRRSRQITMADLFVDRFDSRRLSTAYSLGCVLIGVMNMGLGNVVSYKVTAALLNKPRELWTAAEARSVSEYHEYQALSADVSAKRLPAAKTERYLELRSRDARGQLSSSVSYVKPLPFYLLYSTIVATYVVAGGLKAAAVTDAVQGVLIIILSTMLVPAGLHHIGGFAGLHRLVPAGRLQLFGTAATSDYTWYSVGAIVLVSFVSVSTQLVGPSMASASSERAARIGALGGAFGKRLLTLGWAMSGLLALAVLGKGLSDPDAAWGQLSAAVLMPGLLGLMFAGMLLGHMPFVGVQAMNMSALLTRNLYEPLAPNRSERHYLLVAKASVLLILVFGIAAALMFTSAITLLFTIWLFGVVFSATFWLVYFWRPLTPRAIGITWLLWTTFGFVLPWLLPHLGNFGRSPSLLLRTGNTASVSSAAVGEAQVPQVAPGVPLFFDSIARIDPTDPQSPRQGLGRFNLEHYLLYRLGVPLERFNSAGLLTARWLFDCITPFVMLMGLSYLLGPRLKGVEPEPAPPLAEPIGGGTALLTRPSLRAQPLLLAVVRQDQFFARMKTPVAATPQLDREQVALSNADPDRFDHLKLFPGSSWEFTRWSFGDAVGFLACWTIVFAILALLWLLVHIGG